MYKANEIFSTTLRVVKSFPAQFESSETKLKCVVRIIVNYAQHDIIFWNIVMNVNFNLHILAVFCVNCIFEFQDTVERLDVLVVLKKEIHFNLSI